MSALPQPPAPHAALQRVALPRLSRNEAQARTIIAQRGADLPLQLGSTAWHARLVPATQTTPVATPSYVVHLEWAGSAFVLSLPTSAAQQQVSAMLDGASLPDLPPSLAQAALEASLNALLQSLQSVGRGTPSLVQITEADEVGAIALPHAFDVHVHAAHGPEAIACSLHTDGLGLLLLAGLLKGRANAPAAVDPHVPLRLLAEIGGTRLTTDDLASLRVGDTVLMSDCFITAQRVLWLSANGRAGIHAQLSATGNDADSPTPLPSLTILKTWTTIMPTDTESHVADQPGAPTDAVADAATLQSLPVRLSFDLGEISLSLAQVQALQVGQVLELARPLAGAVCIRANGALIGEGDLVEVDGHIGVSIGRIVGSTN